jgi:hypothetical protein
MHTWGDRTVMATCTISHLSEGGIEISSLTGKATRVPISTILICEAIECSRFVGLVGNQAVRPPTFNANQKRHLQSGHAPCSQHTRFCQYHSHESMVINPSISPVPFDIKCRNMASGIAHDYLYDEEDRTCHTNPDIAGLGVSLTTRHHPYDRIG